MRTIRPLALLSATALAGAALLGGAGIAGASTDSLGSLTGNSNGASDILLTIDEVTSDDTETTVNLSLTNNTTEETLCDVSLFEADVVADAQAAYEARDPQWLPDDELVYDEVDFTEPGESDHLTYTIPLQDDDFVAGALTECWGDDVFMIEVSFAYESGYATSTGSLDLGSVDIGGPLGGSLDS